MAEKKDQSQSTPQRASYSTTQKLSLACSPSLSQTPLRLPKKSACFFLLSGRDTDNTSNSCHIPRELSRARQSCFLLANKSVVYLLTGLFADVVEHSESFSVAHTTIFLSIKSQESTSTFCPSRTNFLHDYTTCTNFKL